MKELKVGSTVYLGGGGDWHPYTITGETRISWTVQYNTWTILKFPKRADFAKEVRTSPIHRNYDNGLQVRVSRMEVEGLKWVWANRYRISQMVQFLDDAQTLREVAKLVGYKE